MGKGGYNGGSTILYFGQHKIDNCNDQFSQQKIFKCPICLVELEYESYFRHLKIDHGVKGCISCGMPYADCMEKIHTCTNCGKLILLNTHNYKKKIDQNQHLHQTTKHHDSCKIIHKPKHHVNTSNPKDSHITHQEKQIKNLTNKNASFGVSLGELLNRALKDNNPQ